MCSGCDLIAQGQPWLCISWAGLHYLGSGALPRAEPCWHIAEQGRAVCSLLLIKQQGNTQGLGPYHPLLVPTLFKRWWDLQAGGSGSNSRHMVSGHGWRLGLMFLELFCVYSAIFSSNNLNFWFTDGSGPTLQDSAGARRWDLYQQYSEQSHWHSLEGAESHQQLSNDSLKCCYYVNKFSFILSRSRGIFLLTIKAK